MWSDQLCGPDCIVHRKDLNEREESEVEVAMNIEPIVEVAPITDVIPTNVD